MDQSKTRSSSSGEVVRTARKRRRTSGTLSGIRPSPFLCRGVLLGGGREAAVRLHAVVRYSCSLRFSCTRLQHPSMWPVSIDDSGAPDIVEATLRGDEPDGLSLRKLQKNLPVCWAQQKEMWMMRG